MSDTSEVLGYATLDLWRRVLRLEEARPFTQGQIRKRRELIYFTTIGYIFDYDLFIRNNYFRLEPPEEDIEDLAAQRALLTALSMEFLLSPWPDPRAVRCTAREVVIEYRVGELTTAGSLPRIAGAILQPCGGLFRTDIARRAVIDSELLISWRLTEPKFPILPTCPYGPALRVGRRLGTRLADHFIDYLQVCARVIGFGGGEFFAKMGQRLVMGGGG